MVSIAFFNGLIKYVSLAVTGNHRRMPGSGDEISRTVRSSHRFANLFVFSSSFSARIGREYWNFCISLTLKINHKKGVRGELTLRVR
jgi:hypothetical protein